MPVITTTLALIVFVAGIAAGGFGALLGLGGGVFLVPLLNLTHGFPLRSAAAISLATVIATSNSATVGRIGKQLINYHFGMALEVATVAGSLVGGITAQLFSETQLQRLFGGVAVLVALAMVGRLNRRNVILERGVDPGRFGGVFHEEESGGTVTYHIKRMPLALLASFAAGNLSSLLGRAAASSRFRVERLVRHADPRRGSDERLRDRRDRDGRRRHVLRPRRSVPARGAPPSWASSSDRSWDFAWASARRPAGQLLMAAVLRGRRLVFVQARDESPGGAGRRRGRARAYVGRVLKLGSVTSSACLASGSSSRWPA